MTRPDPCRDAVHVEVRHVPRLPALAVHGINYLDTVEVRSSSLIETANSFPPLGITAVTSKQLRFPLLLTLVTLPLPCVLARLQTVC
jgi:hypothetical protein